MSVGKQPQLLFILSSERSGSTLLTRMLAQNQRFISPPELWFLRYENFEDWKSHKPEAYHSLEALARQLNPSRTAEFLEHELVEKSVLEVYDALLNMFEADRFLVDKTPGYSNEIRVLKKSLTLNAKYIWLMRHPLGVIDSEMRHADQRTEAQGISKACIRLKSFVQRCLDSGMTRRARRREEKWLLQNDNIEKFLSAVPKDNKIQLQFEDLLREPTEQLKRICCQLDVTYDEKMNDPFGNSIEIKAGIGNPNFNKRTRLDPNLADDWQRRYSTKQLRPVTLNHMLKFGIRTTSSSN